MPIRAFAICALIAVLAACTSRPAGTLIEQQVIEYLTRDGRGRIMEVINFRKTNGIPRDDNTYYAEVSYDLRFKVGLREAMRILQEKSGSIFAAGSEAVDLSMRYGDFEAGDTVSRDGRFRFIRTEKGWRLEPEDGDES